ncbi:hypothetical protein RI367_006589 [Sorochytrium milnesiophthora]
MTLTSDRPTLGFELLETMAWSLEGGIFLLDRHLDRVSKSLAYFSPSIDIPALLSSIRADLEQQARREQEDGAGKRIRLTVSLDGTYKVTASAEQVPYRLFQAITSAQPGAHIDALVPSTGPPRTIVLDTVAVDAEGPEAVFLRHKTTRRDVYNRARAAIGNTSAFDVLLYNRRQEVTECCIANFAVEVSHANGKEKRGLLCEQVLLVEQVLALAKSGARTVCFNSNLRMSLPADDAAAAAQAVAAGDTEEGIVTEATATAQSLRCDDCGKLFRDIDYAQLHGTRSGHVNFSESTAVIKPLTEEERKAKLAEVQQRIAQRREERRLQDLRDVKESERIRRKAGQELSEVQEQLKEKEMQKIVEQKKREKAEDRSAKAKILAQIEQDRKDRLARLQPASQQPPQQAKPPVAAPVASASNATSSRLQIRGAGAAPVVLSFSATDTLDAVYAALAEQGVTGGKLMTTFPKKILERGEVGQKTLKELDLVPSAALNWSR